LTGPAGTSAASSRASQSAATPAAKRSARSGRSWSRLRTRASLSRSAGRGQLVEVERAAQPGPLALAADGDGDLAVGRVEGLVGHDVGVGIALRSGWVPSTKAFWAWLMSTARVLSSSDTSIRWPWPPRSAARTATQPSRPVTMSLIATPTLVGRRPRQRGSR
jgi:hypothetical protein